MAILAQCPNPACRKRQSAKNKICACGENLDKAKRSKRVKYFITYRIGGKLKTEYSGTSIDDARAAHGKRKAQIKENRILEILPEANQTFSQLADWYLDLDKVKHKKKYLKVVKSNLKRFNEVFGDMRIKDLRLPDLESYQTRRIRKFKPKTIDDQIGAARAMVTKALNADLIGGGDLLKPFRLTKNLLRKGDNRRRRHLEKIEYRQIYGALRNHAKLIFAMGYFTGMRTGEILNLTWDKVDLAGRMIYLTAADTKEGRAKRVPITKTLRAELMQLPGPHMGCVFTYGKKSAAMGDITEGLESACDKAGVIYGRFKKDGFIFHDLRHTFITNCRRAGIAGNVRKAITGHSNGRDMDQRYDTISAADLQNAVDSLEVFLAIDDQTDDHGENQLAK
jgi:integrase